MYGGDYACARGECVWTALLLINCYIIVYYGVEFSVLVEFFIRLINNNLKLTVACKTTKLSL